MIDARYDAAVYFFLLGYYVVAVVEESIFCT